MLKLILVCVVLELYNNQCVSESWNKKFDSNIYFLCICVVKKKKTNYLIKNEKMKLKKYFMIESIKILQCLYKPFFSLFSLIKQIEVNIIKI